jgi:hypothetical protein
VTTKVIKLDRSDVAEISQVEVSIVAMRDQYMPLTINGIEDRDGFDRVYEARQDVKGKRIAVEKTRKRLKADVIEFGRLVDGEAKRITDMLTPIEKHLQSQEDAYIQAKAEAKRAQEQAEAAKLQARMDQLIAVRAAAPITEIKAMTDEAFESFLAAKTSEHEERLAAEVAAEIERAKAEAEAARLRAEEETRLAAERAEKEAALKAEQARLAEERARQEAALAEERARLEAERQAHLEAIAKARADQEALIAKQEEERRKIQAEQRALEEQRAAIEREELERQARIEEEARQRLVAERQKREEEAARIEALRQKEEQAAMLESIKPDLQKVREYVGRVMMAVNDNPAINCEELDFAVEEFVKQVSELSQGLIRWPN